MPVAVDKRGVARDPVAEPANQLRDGGRLVDVGGHGLEKHGRDGHFLGDEARGSLRLVGLVAQQRLGDRDDLGLRGIGFCHVVSCSVKAV